MLKDSHLGDKTIKINKKGINMKGKRLLLGRGSGYVKPSTRKTSRVAGEGLLLDLGAGSKDTVYSNSPSYTFVLYCFLYLFKNRIEQNKQKTPILPIKLYLY